MKGETHRPNFGGLWTREKRKRGELMAINCKHCGKNIDRVIAIEKVAQEYYLGEGKDANKYGQGECGKEWQLDTLAYQCPECEGDIESQIERGD